VNLGIGVAARSAAERAMDGGGDDPRFLQLWAWGQLDAWGLTAQDLLSDDMERCQEVADVAARLGAEAIRWPSATGAGQSFAVFVAQLRSGSRAEINKSIDLSHDTLRGIAAGESLTTLIPTLSKIPLLE
jgi:hypothetical protein